jgi:hypothetical protein
VKDRLRPRSRLTGTDPANFLEARFWIASNWATILAANLWTAAFFLPLTKYDDPAIPTHDKFMVYLRQKHGDALMEGVATDYLARQSLSGLHLSDYIVQQLPVVSPDGYQEADLKFIVPRVLELTCTSWDMVEFADDVLQSASKEVTSLTVARRSSLQRTVGDVSEWALAKAFLRHSRGTITVGR